MPDDPIFNVLKKLFLKIDNTPIKEDGFFKNKTEKEQYESSFMIAFRKYQGAKYHYNNVLNLYRLNKQEALKFVQETRNISKGRPFFGGIQMVHNADEYTYELSAFLAAIKSCLDFIATATRPHLKGFDQMDSIRTLMKQVESEGKDEGIFSIILKYLDWLKEMRDYRHKVIHRTIILTKSSVVIKNAEDKSEIFIHSVFIPTKPPRNILDTRKSQQQFLEDFKDYDFNIEINGKIRYKLPEGLSTIEDLMKEYLDKLITFFIDYIKHLLTLGSRLVEK